MFILTEVCCGYLGLTTKEQFYYRMQLKFYFLLFQFQTFFVVSLKSLVVFICIYFIYMIVVPYLLITKEI
jgi:hypothetical protein